MSPTCWTVETRDKKCPEVPTNFLTMSGESKTILGPVLETGMGTFLGLKHCQAVAARGDQEKDKDVHVYIMESFLVKRHRPHFLFSHFAPSSLDKLAKSTIRHSTIHPTTCSVQSSPLHAAAAATGLTVATNTRHNNPATVGGARCEATPSRGRRSRLLFSSV